MENIKLSKKGNVLIKLYEEMAVKGVKRTDGAISYYNDFQLKKFRNIFHFSNLPILLNPASDIGETKREDEME